MIAPRAVGGAGPMIPEAVRLRKVESETADVFTLTLEPPTGAAPGPAGVRAAPGQFNMLYAFGVGEVPISISGDLEQPEQLVHTIRSVGAVTAALQRLRPGDVVGVRGPFGRGWPMAEARGHDVLVVAGGLGLAPLRPVIYEVLRHRAEFRDVTLVVGARSPADLMFRGELASWARSGQLQVLVTVDRGAADWAGPVGVVTSLLREARFDPEHTVAMMCGPEVMMRFCQRELALFGLAQGQIYLSLERNMKCAIGHCGHCQAGPSFLCKDGPVLRYDRALPFFLVREI